MQPKYYGAAAQYNKSGGSSPISKRVLMIAGLGVGVLFIIIIAFMVIGALTRGPQDDFARYTQREADLVTLMDKQKTNVQSADLHTINSTALILFSGDSGAANTLLSSVFSTAAVPDNIIAEVADSTTDATLKNATLTNTFDSVYIGVIRDKITTLYNLARNISSATNNTTLKTALDHSMSDLTSVDDQLSKLKR